MFAITVQRSARHLSLAPWLGRRHGNRTGLSIAEHGSFNCESTSSAMVITSRSNWLKSTRSRLFCRALKIAT